MNKLLSILAIAFSASLFSQVADKVSDPSETNVGSLLRSTLQENKVLNKNTEAEFVVLGGKSETSNLKLGQAKNKAEEEKIKRQYNLDIFLKTKKLAISNYENKEYSECISNYKISEKTGFNDAELNFVAGVSYYKMYEQLNKQEYKTKAKEILKKAEQKGHNKAKVFLNKHFK